MKLKQLEFVLWTTRLGSISKAASKLRVAQPAVSRQIQLIEEELGVQLFHRDGHGARPTHAAEILAAAAVQVFAQIDDAKAEIENSKESPTGEVRLGLPPSLTYYFAANIDNLVKARYPNIHLKISEGWTGYLYDWIISDTIDIGIMYSSQVTEHLAWEPLVTEELCVIGPPSENLYPSEYSLTHVAQLPLVLPPFPHGLRLVIDKAFAKHGLTPNVISEAEVWRILKDQVQNGSAFALLPPSEVREDIEAHRLSVTPIAAPGIRRTLCVARSGQKRTTKAVMKVFESILKEAPLQLPDDHWYLRAATDEMSLEHRRQLGH